MYGASVSIGFIGLGNMGLGMARRLLQSGFEVTGCDVSEDAMQKFVTVGGKAQSTPRDAVEESKCDVLVVMVATAAQASDVLFNDATGVCAVLPKNAVILLCITAAPQDAIEMQDCISRERRYEEIMLLDCPVSGGANRAADGTLSVLFSGTETVPEAALQALEALCTNLFHVRGPAGSAFALKMVHQILVGVHIVAAVETTCLAALAQLDLEALKISIVDSDAESWLYFERFRHLTDLENPPYSSLDIILKDLNLVLSTAKKHWHALPVTTAAQQVFLLTKAKYTGPDDDCMSARLYLNDVLRLSYLESPAKETLKQQQGDVTISTIRDLLIGIQLAAAVEACSFVRKLGLDGDTFYRFVMSAAGASTMFQKVGVILRPSNTTFFEETVKIDDINTKMVGDDHLHRVQTWLADYSRLALQIAALEAAGRLNIAMPLATSSMNSLFTCTKTDPSSAKEDDSLLVSSEQ